MFFLGSKSIANASKVDARLMIVVKKAISISTMDFGIPETGGARTAAEQNVLYKKKVTTKDGYKKISNHQVHENGFGSAVDLVPWIDGKFEHEDWENFFPIASAMSKASKILKIDILWGGNWYEKMSQYDSEVEDMRAALERYKIKHPGPDFIDGPHFQLA